MKRRYIASTIAIALIQMTVVASAEADGLPVPVEVSPDGVETLDGEDRYVAVRAGRDTVVERIQTTGVVDRSKPISGEFTVPAVAYDGSPSGLSADGETLALIRPRAHFPQASTTFAVLDAKRLHLEDVVTLRGDFSFDAISPDGSRIYLIEYLSRSDPTRYEVRAFDVGSGRLLREPIVDPEEPPGEMRGYPMSRVTSPDGRWAYTLYDGGGDHPFVHALDTVERRAVCIDVHALANQRGFDGALQDNYSRFGLDIRAAGAELSVLDRKSPVALVDTETFEVSAPSEEGEGGGFPWLLIMLAALAFIAAVLILGLRRQRHGVAAGGAS